MVNDETFQQSMNRSALCCHCKIIPTFSATEPFHKICINNQTYWSQTFVQPRINPTFHLQILENLDNSTFTIISASFSKKLTKTPDFFNTLFFPQNLDEILANGEEDDLLFRQKSLLCATVRVGARDLLHYASHDLQGQYKFEWITEEDRVNMTSLCGQKMTVYYKNCNIYLSVEDRV